jgi:hypothetical protein
MATNLVSLVEQFLTPDVISRIASALGLDRNNVQSAIAAAVPALLAAFTGAATRPGGAQSLINGIKQQSGLLDGFSNMIGGGGQSSLQSSLADKGATLLSSAIGGQDQSALAGAVAKFAGIGQNKGGSLLAMLTPLVMGVIGKQFAGRNLDAGSLTSLLSSQKDQIAQALPGGFGKLLAGTGLLDSLGGAAGSAAAMAGQTARDATRAATAGADQAASYAAATARSAAGAAAVPAWAYWVVPLVVVAGLAWYLLSQLGGPTVQQTTQQAIPEIPSVMVGGVDIGRQLRDNLATLRTSLQGINDVASARAAIPAMRTAANEVDRVSGMLGQLSDEQRTAIAGAVAPVMASLNQLFDKALAIPGVGELLKPTVDSLRIKLADLSGQPPTVGAGR